MSEFLGISRIFEQASAFGELRLANGAVLYGHTPHVAPEAWFHQVFAPLTDAEIAQLSETIGHVFPEQLCSFLRQSNGLGLFSYALSLYGKRRNYARTGDDVWQPFCIVTANTLERPNHARDGQIVIGGYRQDGSLLFIDRDGSVFRTRARSKKVLNRWESLWAMLDSEVQRLLRLFDAQGRRVSDEKTVPPPDR
jgi:hypothetical protein